MYWGALLHLVNMISLKQIFSVQMFIIFGPKDQWLKLGGGHERPGSKDALLIHTVALTMFHSDTSVEMS